MTSSDGVSAINWNRFGSTCPIAFMASDGAKRSVVSLTDSWMISPILCCRIDVLFWRLTGKDKSKMIRPLRFGCGTTATGDILKFGCRSCLMSSHRTTCKNPAFIWYSMSSWTNSITSRVRAVECAPHATAKVMASLVHGAPQSTGTPFSQSFRWAANGCSTDIRNIGFSKLCLSLFGPPLSFPWFFRLPVAPAKGVGGPRSTSASVAGLPAICLFWIVSIWPAILSCVPLSIVVSAQVGGWDDTTLRGLLKVSSCQPPAPPPRACLAGLRPGYPSAMGLTR
jgi:hypothetical protein